jgi:hypothetical protein
MKPCTHMKKYIFTILMITLIADNNLLASSWTGYFSSFLPSRERLIPNWMSQLASLTRPQLNPQWFRQLSYQWSNLTPTQKNIFLYLALFGTGGAGMSYWNRRKQQQRIMKEQAQERLEKALDIAEAIIESLKVIKASLDKSETLSCSDFTNFRKQLHDLMEKLVIEKNSLPKDTYEKVARAINTTYNFAVTKKQKSTCPKESAITL